MNMSKRDISSLKKCQIIQHLTFFEDQLATFHLNVVQNCVFRFFVQNNKFHDLVRFLSKANFLYH